MRTFFTLIFSLLLTTATWGTCTLAQAEPDPAIVSAEAWLALVDRQEFSSSWNTASSQFQRMISQVQWQQSLKAYRAPLGTVISRSHRTIQRTTTLPGYPDGSYIGITFHSSFTNKASTIETVVLTHVPNGRWSVIGYTMN